MRVRCQELRRRSVEREPSTTPIGRADAPRLNAQTRRPTGSDHRSVTCRPQHPCLAGRPRLRPCGRPHSPSRRRLEKDSTTHRARRWNEHSQSRGCPPSVALYGTGFGRGAKEGGHPCDSFKSDATLEGRRDMTFEGGCYCGKLRYRSEGKVLPTG